MLTYQLQRRLNRIAPDAVDAHYETAKAISDLLASDDYAKLPGNERGEMLG